MKTIIHSILCWAIYFLLASPVLHAAEINLVLIGGQSNATGQGYLRNIPRDFKPDQKVMIYFSKYLHNGTTPEHWIPLAGASESPDRFGVELSMGTKLQHLCPGKSWGIIKHALSGSSLYKQWNPGKNPNDPPGPEYVKFMHTVKAGLDALKKQGHTPVLRAMVWQQGEADAQNKAGMSVSLAYADNLKHLIERIRQDLNAPDLLFLYGSVLPVENSKNFPGRDAVLKAQKSVAEAGNSPLSVKGAVHVPAGDLQLRSTDYKTPYPDDTIHLGTYGILTLGDRFAQAIAERLKRQ